MHEMLSGRAAQEDAPASAGVADILHAVCREIAGAGQLACDLQAVLSGFARVLGQQDQAIEAFQMLDLLAQQLQGVAAFLDALAPTLPTGWAGDAATAAPAVTLSDLAHRLGCPGSNVRTAHADTPGAFELFETGTS